MTERPRGSCPLANNHSDDQYDPRHHGEPTNGDWAQNRKYLFYRLDQIEGRFDSLDRRFRSVELRVAAIVGGILLLGWAIPAAAELLARLKG